MVEACADGPGRTGGPSDGGQARGGGDPSRAERTKVQGNTVGPEVLGRATGLWDRDKGRCQRE